MDERIVDVYGGPNGLAQEGLPMVVQIEPSDLAELSRCQAARLPENVALTFEGRQTTYTALNQRANQVANGR